MHEFMFFIHQQHHSQDVLSPEDHLLFLKACEAYIAELKVAGKLIAAQPIEWDGRIIAHHGHELMESHYDEGEDVIGGYYHILAKDLEEAIQIARRNPAFQFPTGTRIEVRPVKMKEDATGFEYPTTSDS